MVVRSRSYSGPERRSHERHATEATFWLLTDEGTSLLVKSTNVSAGDAYLRAAGQEAADLPAVGARVRFTITSADGVVPDDTKRAEVVRRTPDGIAIRFLDQ
ncbi:PilZ domain-containing protein [Myxococcota bacterium]